MLFSVLTRKDKVPRHSSHPPRYPSLAKRRQISVGNSLTYGSSDSQLSLLKEAGTQHNWPSGSSGHPNGGQIPQTAMQGVCHCCQAPETRMRGGLTTFSRPGPRLVGGLGESAEALQNTPQACSLGMLAQLLAQGWMSWRDSGKGQDPPLILLSASWPPLHSCPNPLTVIS